MTYPETEEKSESVATENLPPPPHAYVYTYKYTYTVIISLVINGGKANYMILI